MVVMPLSWSPSAAEPNAELFETIKKSEKLSSFFTHCVLCQRGFSDGDFIVA